MEIIFSFQKLKPKLLMSNEFEENKATNPDFVDGRVKVDVKIIKAEDLQLEGKDSNKLNSFIQVALDSDPKQTYKTNSIKGPNPEWNETFNLKIQDLESAVLLITVNSKEGNLSLTKPQVIGKRIKISFLSFHYGETKQVVKELHNKEDQYLGKLYIEISLHEDPKAKKKESKLCFSVLAVEGHELEEDNYSVQLKMVADDTSNPITNTVRGTDPVWDEELFIKTSKAKNDVLKVVLLKDDKKYIKSVKFPCSDFSIGQQPITFDDDVFNTKNQKVGHLKFIITPLDYETDISNDKKYDLNVNLIDSKGYDEADEPLTCDLQINGKSVATSKGSKNFKWNENFVVPCNNLQKDVFTIKPSKGDGIAIMLNSLELGQLKEINEEVPDLDDHYIHFTLLPAEHSRRTRSRGNKCDELSFDNLSSKYSTSFSSLPSDADIHSISGLKSGEDQQHHHEKIDAAASNEAKPCRYDNVKGSLTSLDGLIDVANGAESQVYVTMDVISHGLNLKKNLSKKSKKVAHGESPSLKFDLPRIKKGNKLVFTIWQQPSGADASKIGVVEIPVYEIPEGTDASLSRDVQKPADNAALDSYSSFGTASFKLTHSIEYLWPSEKNEKKDDN